MESLSQKQIDTIDQATARLNIWHGAVRSSKTVGSLVKWIRYIGSAPKGDLLMTGKTDGALIRNVLNPMQDMLGSDMVVKKGSKEIFLWGRRIFFFGANDERSEGKIRGMTIAGQYGDEVSLWPESYWKQSLARMSVSDAKGFYTTNPDSPHHHLKKEYIDKITDQEHLKSFHFVLDDNPYLDENYVKFLKQEYVGLWYKRFILGLWVLAEGSIYDFFDEDKHVISKAPGVATRKFIGVDYGIGNPTVFLLFGFNPNTHPKLWLEREYYYDSKQSTRQKTDTQYADDFETFIEGEAIDNIYIDPSALSFINELKSRGIYGITDADNTVIDGIRVQSAMLQSGDYAIVKGDTEKTIEEYSGYSWDPKAQMKGEDKPIKTSDHTKDPERYVMYTRFGSGELDYSQLTKW